MVEFQTQERKKKIRTIIIGEGGTLIRTELMAADNSTLEFDEVRSWRNL
jgi:hypothetical protein